MEKSYLIAGAGSEMARATVKKLRGKETSFTLLSRNKPIYAEAKDNYIPFDATNTGLSISDLPDTLNGMAYFPGTINLKPFRGLSEGDFRQDWEINFLGAVRILKLALKALKKGKPSSVLLFSTVAVQTGMPFHSSISAAKGAVEGFCRAMAAELSPDVRVNAIAPSLTDTALAKKFLATDQKKEASANRHPLKKYGTADDIAGIASSLLGEDGAWITGQIFHIDGGLSSLRQL